MAIEIRPAKPEDYDDLCALSEQVDALHRQHLPHLFRKPPGPAREREFVLGLLADPDKGLFVAEAAGLVIGFVVVEACESPPIPIFEPRTFAVVHDLVVHQRFQRTGIGRRLMERAHRWAAAKGAATVELTVYDFNTTAQAFYESLGYGTQSRRMVWHVPGARQE